MFQAIICGHLGAAAEVKVQDGRQFVTFRVADSRRYTKDGNEVEETQWFSCIMSGDGGELVKYLVKGQQVLVIGQASTRIYSSPKLRRMVASVDINVRSIELLGRPSTDLVPHRIAAPDGMLVDVAKFYAIDPVTTQKYLGDKSEAHFYDERGGSYKVITGGWVYPLSAAEEAAPADESAVDEAAPADESEQATVEPVNHTKKTKQSSK